MFEIFTSRKATIEVIKDYFQDIGIEDADCIIQDLEYLIKELPYHWDESIGAENAK